MNEDYGDRWFFVVTNRKFAPIYKRLGPTCDKRYVVGRISKILKKD